MKGFMICTQQSNVEVSISSKKSVIRKHLLSYKKETEISTVVHIATFETNESGGIFRVI